MCAHQMLMRREGGWRCSLSKRSFFESLHSATFCILTLIIALLLCSPEKADNFIPSLLCLVSAADTTAANLGAAATLAGITETELIAVDLGHENMKIGAWRVQQTPQLLQNRAGSDEIDHAPSAPVVSTGSVSMVLNDQTNRKSPPCVAFRFFKDRAALGHTQQRPHKYSGTAVGGVPDDSFVRSYDMLQPPGYLLERTFAEQAQALAPRFPTQVICSAPQLLGVSAAPATGSAANYSETAQVLTSDQLTTTYSYHVTPLEVHTSGVSAGRKAEAVKNASRAALGVLVPFLVSAKPTGREGDAATGDAPEFPDAVLFSSEELTAMLLGYARRMAEKADIMDNALNEEDERFLSDLKDKRTGNVRPIDAGKYMAKAHPVLRHVALTVPNDATIAQRQALVDAAALAGMRVVRLVHSTTGAAVQLAYMKAEQVMLADKVQHIMIYDMGSERAEVAVYSFSAAPSAITGRVRLHGAIELKSLVGSRTLGGAAFDGCIAERLDARYFGNRILDGVAAVVSEGNSEAQRAAAKQRGSLLRAAQQAKEMLSANQEAHITIDGVRADPANFDSTAKEQQKRRQVVVTADGLLTLRLSRADFESWCSPLFEAAVALRDEAIAASGGAVTDVNGLDRFEIIGGGTRIPRLLQRLGEGYRTGVVDRTLNSDEAAVLGATLLAVSSAPRALGMRSTQAVPRYRVREWLTSSVYAAVAAPASAIHLHHSTTNVSLRSLFPAIRTSLPATTSARIPLPLEDGAVTVDNVSVTLLAGAEVDRAYQLQSPLDSHDLKGFAQHEAQSSVRGQGTVPCSGCYVRTCLVTGIEEMAAHVQRQMASTRVAEEEVIRVRLREVEVVVETVVTVSGIPHCSFAYMRAALEVSTTSLESKSEDGVGAIEELPAMEEEGEENRGNDDGDDDTDAELSRTSPADAQNATQPLESNSTASQLSPSSSPAPRSTSTQMHTRVMTLPLQTFIGERHLQSQFGCTGYNMLHEELARSQHRMRALQDMDDARLRRSTLRNDIESVLVWMKEHRSDWDADDTAVPGADGVESPHSAALSEWRTVVREVGEWLDDFGDTASMDALSEHFRAISQIKTALQGA